MGFSFYPTRRLFRLRVQYGKPVRSDVKRELKSKCEFNFRCYAQGKIRSCRLLRSICSRIKIAKNSKNYFRTITIFQFFRYKYFAFTNGRLSSSALANFRRKINFFRGKISSCSGILVLITRTLVGANKNRIEKPVEFAIFMNSTSWRLASDVIS